MLRVLCVSVGFSKPIDHTKQKVLKTTGFDLDHLHLTVELLYT